MINANRRFTLETGVLETRTNRKLHLVLYSDYLMLTTPSKGRPLKPTEKWIFVRLIDLRHIIMFNVPDSQDGVNMTVIFVSNPSSPSNEHQSGLSPKTAGELTINTQVGSRGDSPPSPSSPRSHSPLAQSSGDGEVARKAKKPPSETTNKYVFQHPDKKSKVDFLIALENELSSLKKSDIHTPPRTNFIHALKPIHTHPHTHTHTHTHSHHTGSK
ncbi:hypothetical protein K493DRAFT_90727 [Basidiobolus meristosporus CBS 931.73]|uniref:Uncharacterized protein n=1 Tax=Basidiobolus meristosporus CBS 931.73 TaxID=1314790 RepID=A0A1Y1XAS4_9FUNG|nr:hypothetical protein K493DRAFT_90727 [Basidiobolus meristosporus CBS 931.73]|eukprot:ORX82855.1 hypothetical protein K493DRAFT_90727 [Basidiobolus meristosporus CBS 931.73]